MFLHISANKPGAKNIKKNTNSAPNKSQTQHAKSYEVTSFMSTDCELCTDTCSKNVWPQDFNDYFHNIICRDSPNFSLFPTFAISRNDELE